MMKPKIRFNGFTDDWEQRKLEEIYQNIGNAFVGTATPYYVDTGHFYLESNNIKDGQINRNNEVFINDEFYERQKDKWLHTGDMVMVQSGHVGHTAVIPEELDNSAAHALIMFRNPKIEIEPYFLNYQYQTIKSKRKINNITTGNTIKHILASDMYNFIVDVSDIEEQQQIANYFLELDHLITLHQRKCDGLKKLKKYMLQNMFPQNGEKTPKIRFQGFINAWEQRKLGELTIYRNGTGHEEKQSESGKYELINLNSISIDGGLKPSGKFIDEETETLLKDDLVMVLSDVGHGDLLGRVAIIPENNRFVLNQRVALLRNNSSVDIKYLFSYINAHQIYFKKQGAGSSQLNISRGSVENFEVLLPHKDEQKKIGKYLSSIDNLITLHQRKCDGLKKLKKYMLQNMFPQNGEKTPKIRFQGFINAWEQRKLSELVQIERGGSPRPIEAYITDAPNGLNWVKIGDAPVQGHYITKTAEKIKPEGLSKTRQVQPGDLILSNSMSFGKPYIMGIDGCIHDGWLLIRDNKKAFDLTFLYHLLGTPQMLSQYKSLAAGSTVNNLNKELVGGTIVTIPNLDEQQVLGQYLESLDNLITLHQRKVEQMKNLKKYMLQNMFPAEK